MKGKKLFKENLLNKLGDEFGKKKYSSKKNGESMFFRNDRFKEKSDGSDYKGGSGIFIIDIDLSYYFRYWNKGGRNDLKDLIIEITNDVLEFNKEFPKLLKELASESTS